MDDEEYKAEFGALDRLGGELDEEGKTLNEYDPVFRFYMFVNIVAKSLRDAGIVPFASKDLKALNVAVRTLPFPRYKNPTGVVVGYHVSDAGQALNRRKLEAITPSLSDLEYPISLVDAIRYARMWLAHYGHLSF